MKEYRLAKRERNVEEREAGVEAQRTLRWNARRKRGQKGIKDPEIHKKGGERGQAGKSRRKGE